MQTGFKLIFFHGLYAVWPWFSLASRKPIPTLTILIPAKNILLPVCLENPDQGTFFIRWALRREAVAVKNSPKMIQ